MSRSRTPSPVFFDQAEQQAAAYMDAAYNQSPISPRSRTPPRARTPPLVSYPQFGDLQRTGHIPASPYRNTRGERDYHTERDHVASQLEDSQFEDYFRRRAQRNRTAKALGMISRRVQRPGNSPVYMAPDVLDIIAGYANQGGGKRTRKYKKRANKKKTNKKKKRTNRRKTNKRRSKRHK